MDLLQLCEQIVIHVMVSSLTQLNSNVVFVRWKKVAN